MSEIEALIRERFPLDANYAEHTADAAVLIALTRETDPRVVFILRAGHLNSHAGEVAFPGGKREDGDDHPLHTALRETHEEIGLAPSAVDVIGMGPSRVSRWGLNVQSYIGIFDPSIALIANPDEIAEVFSLPLSWLRSRENLDITEVERNGKVWKTPSFSVNGMRIWGLTAVLMVEVLNELFDYAPDIELWPRDRGGK